MRLQPLLAALALAGCPSTPPPEPPHVEAGDGGYPKADASPEDGEDPPVETAAYPVCVKACAVLKRFACPEADRLDGGRTCYAVCADAERNAKFPLNPSCVARASSVEDIRACKTVRCAK